MDETKKQLGLTQHPFTVTADSVGRTNRTCTVCGYLPADHIAIVEMARAAEHDHALAVTDSVGGKPGFSVGQYA